MDTYKEDHYKHQEGGEARHGSAIRHNGMFIWWNFGLPPYSTIDNSKVVKWRCYDGVMVDSAIR